MSGDREGFDPADSGFAAQRAAILSALPAHISLLDPDGTIVEVNEAWSRFASANALGDQNYCVGQNYIYVCEQARGDCQEEARQAAAGIRAVLDGELPEFALEYPCHGPTEKRWFRLMVSPIDPHRRKGAVVMHINITDRKLAEEERHAQHLRLARAERRLSLILESAVEGIHGIGPDGRIVFENPAACAMLGWRADEMIGRDAHTLIHHHREDGRPYPVSACPICQTLHDGKERRGVNEIFFRKDGTGFPVELSCAPMRDETGTVAGAVVCFRDVSELRASEERFRTMFRDAATSMVLTSLDGRIVEANAAYCRMVEYTEAELRAIEFRELTHPDDRPRNEKLLDEIVRGKRESFVIEKRYNTKSGGIVWARVSASCQRDADGFPAAFIGVMEDITAQRTAEQQLAEQAALLDEASDAILVRDLDNRIAFWNRRAEELYGWSADEAKGCLVADLLYEDLAPLEQATAAVLEHDEWSGELEHRTRAGTTVTVLGRWTLLRDPDGAPRSILALNADITERKRLEAQFLRSQRMESIGTLAGGIAHDLNNILSPILMAIEVLREQVGDGDSLALLDTLHASARRGADLVSQILGVARGMEGNRVVVDPAAVIEDVRRIALDTFPRNIDLHIASPGEDLWNVHGDPTQLHQVVMNLCVNARDAMPDGGAIKITLENRELDEVFSGMDTQSSPGPYVIIAVEDTGIGMAPEVQAKVFEPFFTTKELGRGTGLGLSTTFTIVKNHGGFINLYSTPGKGTTFKVFLPAVSAPEDVGELAEGRAGRPPLPRGHGELILLVDDEENVRLVTRKALERFGYRVLEAPNGAVGVSLYVRHAGEIDAVLTDMSMPVMDGPAMVVALKSIDPGVRIIGSSGLTAEGSFTKATGADIEDFVPKPYTVDVLLATLRKVLNNGGEAGANTPPNPGRADPAPDAPRATPQKAADAPAPKSARVLIVEDEPNLLDLAARVLTSDGHTVSRAGSGEEALEVLDAQDGAMDVILADVHMPGIGGEGLYSAATSRYPDSAFVFVTGEGRLPDSLAALAGPAVTVLCKPYTSRALKDVIKRVLGP